MNENPSSDKIDQYFNPPPKEEGAQGAGAEGASGAGDSHVLGVGPAIASPEAAASAPTEVPSEVPSQNGGSSIFSDSPPPKSEAEKEETAPAAEGDAPAANELTDTSASAAKDDIDLAATVVDPPDSADSSAAAPSGEGQDLKLEAESDRPATEAGEKAAESKPATDPAFLAAFAVDLEELQKKMEGLHARWREAGAKAGDDPRLDEALDKFDRESQELVSLVRTPALAPAADLDDDARPGAFDFGGGASTAPAGTPGAGTAVTPRAPRGGDSGGFGFRDIIQIMIGGLLAAPTAQLILWWLPGDLSRDPLDLGKKLPDWLKWVAPEKFHATPKPEVADNGKGKDKKGNGDNVVKPNEQKDELKLIPGKAFTPGPDGKLPVENPMPATVGPGRNDPPKKEKKPEKPPAPMPMPRPVAEFGVTDAPEVKPNEFGADLKAAMDAFTALTTAMKNGEGDPAKERTAFYRAFCKLGASAAFSDPKHSARLDRIARIEGEMNATTSIPGLLLRISQYGPGAVKRNHLDGVYLFGKVESSQQEGRLFRINLKMAGVEEPVRIYMEHDPLPKFPNGSHALILGALVHKPSEKLRGFSGSDIPVVWSSVMVKVDDTDVPPAPLPSDGM